MKVADILKTKARAVKTVGPEETALAFAEKLKEEHIGGMIVSRDGRALDGIISERDLAYGLAAYRDKLQSMRVSELMTKAVIVCTPEDSIAEIMNVMTQRRIRHLPVKDGEQLIVSSASAMC
jgi:CBS domain-containing protein